MKEFDRVKDEYQYIVEGELAICGDDMAMGVIKDWENRYNESEHITNALSEAISAYFAGKEQKTQCNICSLKEKRYLCTRFQCHQ